jgi:hypothetical protein
MHVLSLLREMGLDPASTEVRRAVGRDRVTWQGCGPPECDGNPFFTGEVEPWINGQVAASGAYFGQRLRAAVLAPDGWDPPSVISESRAPQYSPLTVGMDKAGNATAIWLESGPLGDVEEPAAVWTNRFQNGRGWGRRERLGFYPHTSGGGTLVTDFDATGRAVAVWRDDAALETSFYRSDGWTARRRSGHHSSAALPACAPIGSCFREREVVP